MFQPNKTSSLSILDLVTFFTLINGIEELSQIFGSLTKDQQALISNQVNKGISINQIVSIVIAILIITGALSMVYLSISILRLKNKVL